MHSGCAGCQILQSKWIKFLSWWLDIVNVPHPLSWGHFSAGLLEIIGLSLSNEEPNRGGNEDL